MYKEQVCRNGGGGGNVAGGLTATLYVLADNEQPVEVGFKKADGTLTDRLVVSKWENAFERSVNGAIRFVTSNFIDDDPDRFQIYVKDRRRTESTILCFFYDTPSNPNDWSIEPLYRQPDGTYLSTNHIIVVDAADADNSALRDAGAVGPLRSWMSKRALGEQVQAAYSYDGMGAMVAATVGVDVKTLTVDVAAMGAPGNGEWADYPRHMADMEAMRERYAQANIRVVPNIQPNVFPLPPCIAADPTDWCVNTPSTSEIGKYALTEEAKAIIDAANLPTNHIRVIYVPGPLTTYDEETGSTNTNALGFAVARYAFQNADEKYFDTCFVTAPPYSNYVPSHEGVHLLGWDTHWTHLPWNLMYGKVPSLPPSGKDPRAIKRLTQDQVDVIRMDLYRKLQ